MRQDLVVVNTSGPPDVVFVQCPMMCHYWPPAGIAYLSEYLRKHGYHPRLLDFNIECFHKFDDRSLFRSESDREWYDEARFNRIRDRYAALIDEQAGAVVRSGAPVVGFSVSGTNRRWTSEIARRVRRLAPDRLIVFGGAEFARPEAVGSYEGVADVYAIGEGEQTLLEILERRRTGRTLEGLPGVVAQRPDGATSPFEPRPLQKNLDEFSFPTLAEADPRRYLFPNVCISSSRGCVRRCVFCSDHPRWATYRSRSVASVMAEMEFHARLKLSETFYVTSSLLNADPAWLEALCDALIERPTGWSVTTQMIVDRRMTPEFLRKCRRAGINRMEYGVESGSDRILKAMNKGFTRDLAVRVLTDTHAAGIAAEINLIPGFPGETEEDHQETLRFLGQIAPSLDAIKSINTCSIHANTPLRLNFEEYGIENPDDVLGWRIGETNTLEIRQRREHEQTETARRLGIYLAFEHQPVGLASYVRPEFVRQAVRHPLMSARKFRRVLRWRLAN